jgi:REP element-mobilizing transposase RayT
VKYGCEVVAINGIEDHVHLLVTLPTTVDIATVVKQAKGVSSHAANDSMQLPTPFKWQGSYGAFTVSRWDVDRVVAYIKRQKEHHAAGQLIPEFEATFDE